MLVRVFVITLILFCSSAIATTVVPPATLGDLQGAWLGGSEANSEYFRLEIDPNGKGVLTVQSASAEHAEAYEVLATQLAKYTVKFELRPISGAEPMYFRGTADAAGMELEAGNVEHRWHRKVVLEREREVLSRIEAVTKRAREVSAPAH